MATRTPRNGPISGELLDRLVAAGIRRRRSPSRPRCLSSRDPWLLYTKLSKDSGLRTYDLSLK